MILIDNREDRGIRGAKSSFMKLFPVNTSRMTRLEYGDFAFKGYGPDNKKISIGIERKSVPDLLNSIISKRLMGHQIPGLVEHYDRAYLLVEGEMIYHSKSNALLKRRGKAFTPFSLAGTKSFTKSHIDGVFCTLQEFCGVRIIRSASKRETAMTVFALSEWWARKYTSHKAHTQFNPHQALFERSSVRPNQFMKVAASLEGVGPTVALELARAVPSINNLMNMTAEELQEVPKVGKVLAQKIEEMVDEENNYYVG